jgi:hypothetical protein
MKLMGDYRERKGRVRLTEALYPQAFNNKPADQVPPCTIPQDRT